MSPEAFHGLAHSDRHLAMARQNEADFPELCAREAYIAAFHAAQAFIFDQTGAVAKTHRGVRNEFSCLIKDIADRPPWIDAYLGQGLARKQVADYGDPPDRTIAFAEAREALVQATQFVAWVRSQLAE